MFPCKIRALILDFDGVVNDSFHEGLRRIRNLCAIEEISFGRTQRKNLTELWGLPGKELLMQGLGIPEALADAMYPAWERLDLADPIPLIPGAKETLLWLRRNDFRTALLTSRNRQNIHDIFERIDLTREFSVIATRQDVPYRKPDPRVFDFLLGELSTTHGVAKDECIFVGDTPADLNAGTAAGIRTLLVQTGPYLLRHARNLPIALEDV